MEKKATKLQHLGADRVAGFNYRDEEEIIKRIEIQQFFHLLAKQYRSKLIEVPIVGKVSTFIGSRPKPLQPTGAAVLFVGNDPEGNSIAIRYEGTVMVAEKIVEEIALYGLNQTTRYHYFQEMIRLEFQNKLDWKHQRAFHQAGVEMFSFNKDEHQKNIVDVLSLTAEFLPHVGSEPVIRVSHIDISRNPLMAANTDQYTYKKIQEYMEEYKTDTLVSLLTRMNFAREAGKALIALSELKVAPIEKALEVLKQYPQFFSEAIASLSAILDNLPATCRELTKFDAGIKRSLNFYSGLTFQCDVKDMPECSGGGEFCDMIQSYGIQQKVFAVGIATGVERLMKISKASNNEN